MRERLVALFEQPNLLEDERVFVVSFPRSGHHALVNFLDALSDFADDYCEFYACERHDGQPIQCPKRALLADLKLSRCGARKRITKNHDFGLRLQYNPRHKYIVQYRHPFHSIRSWYDMEAKKGTELPDWRMFFEQKLRFWLAFVDKWVVKLGNHSNVFCLPHELMADKSTIVQLALFAGAELKPTWQSAHLDFVERGKYAQSDVVLAETERRLLPLLSKIGVSPLYSAPQANK